MKVELLKEDLVNLVMSQCQDSYVWADYLERYGFGEWNEYSKKWSWDVYQLNNLNEQDLWDLYNLIK